MAVARNLILGIDPESGLSNTYSWDIAPDLNSDSMTLSCGYVPHTKGSQISTSQETLFIGGVNCTKMYQTLRSDLAQDDGTDFVADAILNNTDPTLLGNEAADTKRFVRIDFPTISPYEHDAVLQYCKNTNNPHETPAAWETFTHATGSIRAFFNGVTARFVNIRIRKTTAIPANVPVLSSFVLFYYRLMGRKGKDS